MPDEPRLPRPLLATPAPGDGTLALLRRPLPELRGFDTWLARGVGLLAAGQVRIRSGARHIAADRDPFVLALNHGTRREAVLVPTLMMLLRGGRRIHFLADWNFALIPGVGLLYTRSGVITVTRKSVRPRFLNVLKPLYQSPVPPMEQARQMLVAGRSVGIYPEGTVNRDPERLLRGRNGAAWLSLETQAPVVPVGIHYVRDRGPAGLPRLRLELDIGAPLHPPSSLTADPPGTRAWHGEIMTAISRLSGKSWPG